MRADGWTFAPAETGLVSDSSREQACSCCGVKVQLQFQHCNNLSGMQQGWAASVSSWEHQGFKEPRAAWEWRRPWRQKQKPVGGSEQSCKSVIKWHYSNSL